MTEALDRAMINLGDYAAKVDALGSRLALMDPISASRATANIINRCPVERQSDLMLILGDLYRRLQA